MAAVCLIQAQVLSTLPPNHWPSAPQPLSHRGQRSLHYPVPSPAAHPPTCTPRTKFLVVCVWGVGRGALEGKGPQRRPPKRVDGRLEEVANAVGSSYCRLQMSLNV